MPRVHACGGASGGSASPSTRISPARIGVEAEQDARQFGAARAHQAGHAEHLAGLQVEGDVLDDAGLRDAAHRRAPCWLGPAPRLARRERAGRSCRPTISVTIRSIVKLGPRTRRRPPAVAQHDDVVAQPHHVAEDVADIDDRDALRAQPADDLEQPLRLARGQRRRRLVEDDEPRLSALSALAISTSWRSPCGRRHDRRRGRDLQVDERERLLRLRSRSVRRSMNGRPRTSLGKMSRNMFSATLRLGNRLSSWWMKAMPSASASREFGGATSAPVEDRCGRCPAGGRRRGCSSSSTCPSRSRRPGRAPGRRQLEADVAQHLDAEEALVEPADLRSSVGHRSAPRQQRVADARRSPRRSRMTPPLIA